MTRCIAVCLPFAVAWIAAPISVGATGMQTAVPISPSAACQIHVLGSTATQTATSSTTGDPCPPGMPPAGDTGASVDSTRSTSAKPAKRPCKRSGIIQFLSSRQPRSPLVPDKC